MKIKTTHLILVVAVAAVATYYCQAQRKSGSQDESSFRQLLTMDTKPLERQGALLKSYADVIDRVEPAVVKISTFQDVYLRRRSAFDDPILRRLFGIPEPESRGQRQSIQTGLGSGFIVTKDGYILTNNHVIQGATDIKVSLPGREESLDAKIVSADPNSDVAVIKIAGENYPTLTLADSSQVRRGDIVFAVGAPFGYDQSVSMGIVSALGRREVGVVGRGGAVNFIQTDAAINPGNSGGPLIDADGRVIGINTAIYSNTGQSAGVGFAIPINRVIQIASQLINPQQGGQSGYLGVELDGVTAELAKFLKLPEVRGAYVSEVMQGSPAEKAGLKVDDVILDFQGRRVETATALIDEIRGLPAGRPVKLVVLRNGQKLELEVVLGDAAQAAQNISPLPGKPVPKVNTPFKMRLAPLDNDYREQLGLSRRAAGLVVEEVLENSDAARKGLQPGDLIVRINRLPVTTLQEADAAFKESGDKTSLLHVWRGGRTYTVLLEEE